MGILDGLILVAIGIGVAGAIFVMKQRKGCEDCNSPCCTGCNNHRKGSK